jgi:hypothetical protein
MSAAIFALLRVTARLAAASLAAAAIGVFLVTLVYAAEPGAPLVAQAQVPKQKDAKTESKSALTRCIETWDPQTQMSKQEWTDTCKRTTKEYPSLYDKPY